MELSTITGSHSGPHLRKKIIDKVKDQKKKKSKSLSDIDKLTICSDD